MKRIETTIENLKADIGNFYKYDKHHFIVMNAVDLGKKIEVQWFFSDYDYPCEVTMFCTQVEPSQEIPFVMAPVSLNTYINPPMIRTNKIISMLS